MKTSHTSGMKRGSLAVAASVLLLLCVAATGTGVAGPIKVSANGRYFIDQQGQPFFWLGDTAWSKIYPAILADVVKTPVKPVVLGEPAYENGPEYPLGPITPLIVRRQAWWTVMAGAFFTYGQDQMWRMREGWDKTFDTPGAGHVCNMKEILTSLPWWEFTPDQGVFATGVSSERTLNTALRSPSGDRVLIYLSSQCTVFVHLDKIAAAQAKATFINPATGERRPAGTYRTGNLNGRTFPDGQTQFFTTPGHWEDAVLLLEGVKEVAK